MTTPRYSITTRFGDAGKTRLFSGETVLKCDPRPEAYGDLDELVSVLGVARCHCRHASSIELVLWLQRQLFVIGSELATTGEAVARLPRRCDAALLADLDQRRDQLEASITMPTGFIIPGGLPGSAHLDHARTIARRLERKVVALAQHGRLDNESLLAWLNRLSDLLWLLARAEEDQPIMVRQTPA